MSADYKTLHELQTLDEWAFDDRGRLDRLFERSPRFLRWMDGVGQMQQHVRSLEGRLAALQKGDYSMHSLLQQEAWSCSGCVSHLQIIPMVIHLI